METWISIPGWQGLYEVSDHGRVRSVRRCGQPGRKGGQVLAFCFASQGYPAVSLSRRGAPYARRMMIHRLVASAFLGPVPKGMEVCHNDGNRRNCAVSNLRYDTRSNNAKDRVRHGTIPDYRGERSPSSKLTADEVKAIRSMRAAGESGKELARLFGVSQQNVCDIVKRRTWAHI